MAINRAAWTPDKRAFYWHCDCDICLLFKRDAETWTRQWEDIDKNERSGFGYRGGQSILGKGKPFLIDLVREEYAVGRGCELCGSRDAAQIPFCPPTVKEFFEIPALCHFCRNIMFRVAKEWDWQICWGATSDDEIKWFLSTCVYLQFRQHMGREFPMYLSCCVDGVHARRAHTKPKPYDEIWRERHPEWARERDAADARISEPRVTLKLHTVCDESCRG